MWTRCVISEHEREVKSLNRIPTATKMRGRPTTPWQRVGRFRGSGLKDVIMRALAIEATAPDELVLAIVAWRGEDGAPGISVNFAWRGDAGAGAEAMRTLTAHGDLFETDVSARSWLQQQAQYVPIPFGLRQYWKGHLVDRVDETLAEALVSAAEQAGGSSFCLVELIHGRAQRIPESSAAFGGRAAVANVTALAIWDDAANDAAEIAWARRFADSVEHLSLRGGGYLNYPELDQTAGRVAAAYPPESWNRLRQLKRRSTPTIGCASMPTSLPRNPDATDSSTNRATGSQADILQLKPRSEVPAT
jgi:FAD/FMN-containing dehydrogenase